MRTENWRIKAQNWTDSIFTSMQHQLNDDAEKLIVSSERSLNEKNFLGPSFNDTDTKSEEKETIK